MESKIQMILHLWKMRQSILICCCCLNTCLLCHFPSSTVAWRCTSSNSVTRNYCCRTYEVTLSFMDTLIALTYLLPYSSQESLETVFSLSWCWSWGLLSWLSLSWSWSFLTALSRDQQDSSTDTWLLSHVECFTKCRIMSISHKHKSPTLTVQT